MSGISWTGDGLGYSEGWAGLERVDGDGEVITQSGRLVST